MTAPRWLREQRRAQARLSANLTLLPSALDFVTKQVISLRMHADGLAHQIDALYSEQFLKGAQPVQMPR